MADCARPSRPRMSVSTCRASTTVSCTSGPTPSRQAVGVSR
ncbi:hypothetical protein [Ornithinimicrobium kibberense]